MVDFKNDLGIRGDAMYRIAVFPVFLILAGCAGTMHNSAPPAAPAQAKMPSTLSADVSESETDGRSLYQSYKQQKGQHEESAEITAARDAINNFCSFKYQVVVRKGTRPGVDSVYFLGEDPAAPSAIVWGRDYRVDVKTSGNRVLSVEPSTKSCFVFRKPHLPKGDSLAAVVVTDILTPAPSEFHVFQGLLHSQTVYVYTSRGGWKVDNGKIAFLGK